MSACEKETDPLERYGHNLTELAIRGVFSPLPEQERAVDWIFQPLRRRHNGNPVLLDFAEIRRWRVVAEAIYQMAAGSAPDPLPTWRVIALDSLVCESASQYQRRGQGQGYASCKALVCLRCYASGNRSHHTVLFIDHFHRLVGDEKGLFDASELLRPALQRREIQRTGICILEQYRRDIERNAPIQRCCQPFLLLRLSRSI